MLKSKLSSWLEAVLGAWQGKRRSASPELAQARALIAAVDAGGVPLFPGKVNQIARALGLEVSGKAPVEETIERIRQAVARTHRL
jgi:hypothetical protein